MKTRVMLLVTILVVTVLVCAGPTSADSIPVFGYDLINTFPHDSKAFTQGLVYHNGFLYEGTGLFSGSSLRKVVLETGEVLFRYNLNSVYFGEGVAILNDLIYQLTWLNHVGFVYVETGSFELVDTFSYPTPGWGLTHDDTSLIMSDGTDNLYFLDPVSFEEVRRVHVTVGGAPLDSLNELEYIHGYIYANILERDFIAIIKPGTGVVVGWLDLTGILTSEHLAVTPGPLNGIAFDPDSVRLFVTGKRWPSLFEIYVDPLDCGVDGPCGGEEDWPEAASLYQNQPNPFRPATAIRFTIPGREGADADAHLTVHDVRGRTVATLIDRELPPGDHRVTWNGRDDRGERVSSGIYFCVLRVGEERLSRKMAVLE
ncbi:MAG: glutaminyl-peptide cyclotransferase [Candidatus Eisenbacteria bacterium]